MKLDIFLFEQKTPGCNLAALRQEGTAFALITTADNFTKYSSQDRECFQFIEIVADMNLDTVSIAVSKLIREYDKKNVRIICGTEMVLTLGAELREKLSIDGDSVDYVKRFIDAAVYFYNPAAFQNMCTSHTCSQCQSHQIFKRLYLPRSLIIKAATIRLAVDMWGKRGAVSQRG